MLVRVSLPGCEHGVAYPYCRGRSRQDVYIFMILTQPIEFQNIYVFKLKSHKIKLLKRVCKLRKPVNYN